MSSLGSWLAESRREKCNMSTVPCPCHFPRWDRIYMRRIVKQKRCFAKPRNNISLNCLPRWKEIHYIINIGGDATCNHASPLWVELVFSKQVISLSFPALRGHPIQHIQSCSLSFCIKFSVIVRFSIYLVFSVLAQRILTIWFSLILDILILFWELLHMHFLWSKDI